MLFFKSVSIVLRKFDLREYRIVSSYDNSMYMTFKDLDTLECIRHGDVIIPTTNILKRHEALFNMMGIDPVVLQNTKLKKATLDPKNYKLVYKSKSHLDKNLIII